MKVTTVAVSQPRIPECKTAEDILAYCARVSNPTNQSNTLTAPRLLAYLVRNQHWSPFEMVSVTMEIVTTRDIARQILRHRSFSFQEFSQRYAAVDQPAPVLRECRLQDVKNRQNSLPNDDKLLAVRWADKQAEAHRFVMEVYDWALKHDIAKEVARAVLPEGLTESRLYMAGTVRSWLHYVELRTQAGTQAEHRDVARSCADQLLAEFPSLVDVLGEGAKA
jgi:thymidylate synthase (FAD)